MSANSMKYFFLLLLIFSAGCEITSTVDYDFPDYQKRIAVTGFIGLGNRAEVYVSTSHLPLSLEKDSIYDAEVSLFADGKLVKNLIMESDSVYVTHDFLPEVDKAYSIKVNIEGFPEATSRSEIIPPPVKIDSVICFKNIEKEILVKTYFSDPAVKNYYAIKYIRSYNDTLVSETDTKYSIVNPGVAIDDKLFNSKNYFYEIKLNLNAGRFNNKPVFYNQLEVILFSLSKAGYEFFNSLDEMDLTNQDMYNSPTVIQSNILNGYGIFSSYSTDTLKINLE